jgi:type IV secretion system protein VirD4
MGIVSVVMLVIGAVMKMFASIFKLCAGLHQQGFLIPTAIITCGLLYAQTLEEPFKIVVSTVSVFIGCLTWYAFFRKNKHLKPFADMVQRLKTPPIEKLYSPKLSGFVFGRRKRRYVTKPEGMDGHALIVGGVGSGKSSCIAIPTLRAWNNSVFAIDIKGELYNHTQHFRPNIKVFNPLDTTSYGYNPYYCLRTSHNPTQEARAISQAIIPLPPDIKDGFWIESAQNIFTACILHFSAQGFSFLETIQQIQSIPIKTLIHDISTSSQIEAKYFVTNFLNMEDKVLSGIVSEVSKNIVPFVTDKNLIHALSRTKNITPDDLECGNDVYINIPEHLLRQWKPLLTLIVSQFLTHFERRNESNATPILFLLDEFPRLGKIGAMLDGLATLRSKKITIAVIVQSLAQLDMIYGENERKVICDTCAFKAILGATDADTQEYFSRLVGTYDKLMTSHGKNFTVMGLGGGTSTNTNEAERRTIKPEEFGLLNDIVLLTPYGMLRVDKVPYYLQ